MADISINNVPDAQYPPNTLPVIERRAPESLLIEVQTLAEL